MIQKCFNPRDKRGRFFKGHPLNTTHRSFASKIVDYFDAISKRIEDIFQRQKDHALEEIHRLMEDMTAIHSIAELEWKTAGIFYRTVESINGYVHDLQIDAENFFLLSSINQERLTTDI